MPVATTQSSTREAVQEGRFSRSSQPKAEPWIVRFQRMVDEATTKILALEEERDRLRQQHGLSDLDEFYFELALAPWRNVRAMAIFFET